MSIAKMDKTTRRRLVFGNAYTNIQPRVNIIADRFVSRRVGVDHQAVRSKIFSDSGSYSNEDDILSQDPRNWRSKGYVNQLNTTLLNHTPETRILQLTEGCKLELKGSRRDGPESRGWPCAPRRKPVVGQPELIFDLPGYELNMHNDILDWGKWDLLIAALGSKIFMWHSPSNNIMTAHTFEEDNITVAKWDPAGKFIAIGTFFGRLYCYDYVVEKIFPVTWQNFRNKKDADVSITALSWERYGCEIACCTSAGAIVLCYLSSAKMSLFKRNAHTGDILAVQYSPDGRFLVTSGLDCMVRLWMLPEIEPCFEIVYANPARALAWHPWKGCTLAVGGGMGARSGLGDGSLSVWDVARQLNVCHRLSSIDCSVDALAWSHHTGELVVSYWIEGVRLGNESEEHGHTRLLILSGPGKVTDELTASPGRTRALLFNPDGTKIASATSDENLFIWNFFGKPGPLLNMYKRKMKRKTLYRRCYEINEFNNFGVLIR